MLALGACQDGGTGDTTPPTTATTTTGAAEILRYSLIPDEDFTYRVDVNQRVVLTSEGEAAVMDSGSIPSAADYTVTASGLVTFHISEGSEPDLYQVLVVVEFDEMSADGTVDGEVVRDPDELTDLGVAPFLSSTFEIDDRGRMAEQPADPEHANVPVGGVSDTLGRFVGPVLPADGVAVGDSWTETVTYNALGSIPVATTAESILVETAESDGMTVLVVETDSRTQGGELDVGPLYREFFEAFAETDPTSPTVGDLSEIRFTISVDPAAGRSTIRLDPAGGRVLQASVASTERTRVDVVVPGEVEMERFTMSLDVELSADYELVEGEEG